MCVFAVCGCYTPPCGQCGVTIQSLEAKADCLELRLRLSLNAKTEITDLLKHPKNLSLFVCRLGCPGWGLNKTQKDVVMDF